MGDWGIQACYWVNGHMVLVGRCFGLPFLFIRLCLYLTAFLFRFCYCSFFCSDGLEAQG